MKLIIATVGSLVLTTFGAFATSNFRETPPTENIIKYELNDRIVAIDDVILGSNVNKVISKLYSFMHSKRPVTVAIDSVGGSATAGFEIIKAIETLKSNDTNVQCVVTGMAASMAAWIYLHCSTRYALPQAQFMWHFAKAYFSKGVVLGMAEFADGFNGLKAINQSLVADLLEYLPVTKQAIVSLVLGELVVGVDTMKEIQDPERPQFLTVIYPTAAFLEVVDTSASLSEKRKNRNTLEDVKF